MAGGVGRRRMRIIGWGPLLVSVSDLPFPAAMVRSLMHPGGPAPVVLTAVDPSAAVAGGTMARRGGGGGTVNGRKKRKGTG